MDNLSTKHSHTIHLNRHLSLSSHQHRAKRTSPNCQLSTFYLIMCFLCVGFAGPQTHAQNDMDASVLNQHTVPLSDNKSFRLFFIHSKHPSTRWAQDVQVGLIEGLHKLGINANGRADHIRQGLDEITGNQNLAETVLLKSMNEWKPDLVVVNTTAAAKALLKFDPEKFSQWPILFIAMPNLPKGLRESFPNATAVLDYFPLKENIALAQRLHPDADRIILIGTSSKPENTFRFKIAKQLIQQYHGRSKLISYFDVPIDQLFQKIGHTTSKDVIIDMKYYIDNQGNNVYVDNFLPHLQALKSIPIYSFWRPTRDYAIDGGKLFDEKLKGINAAPSAAKILLGTSPKDVPVSYIDNSHYMFYWDELRKHKTQRYRLPDNAIVFNEPILLTDLQWKILFSTSLFVAIQIAFILYLLRNIRQRKIAEFKLRLARDEAQKANRVKSRFLANMSHEIRTPMNAILGFSEILDKQLTTPENRDHIQAILTSGRNLMMLINDVLDLSKIEAEKIVIHKRSIRLKTVIEEIDNIFVLAARDKGITFTLNWDKDIPHYVIIDEIRLRQILFNIIGNAIKFTHQGSVRVDVKKIALPTAISQFDLQISVHDTGIGIDSKSKKTIFKAFVQADGQDSGKYGGTGLGLAISKRLTEMMNGKITVTSQHDEGTTFTLTFKEVEIASLQVDSKNTALDGGEIQFNGETVLVAEDNALNRQLLKEIAKDVNLVLDSAENGQIALQKIHQQRPDLVIMDIEMPIMNGIEAIKALRANPVTNDLPIIVLTASSQENEQSIIDTYHLVGFLKKPVAREQLLNCIKLVFPSGQPSLMPTSTNTVRLASLEAHSPPSMNDKTATHHGKSPLKALTGQQHAQYRALATTDLLTASQCRDIDAIEHHLNRLEELEKDYQSEHFLPYINKYRQACTRFHIATLSNAYDDFCTLIDDHLASEKT